ncbi:hypothetical protein BD770DRAFT_400228 [Pilaira anomala]|nr:hypothetical protein BD770DRAFT_400228 [Pilaira anomala]
MDSILEWNPQLNSQCTNMYNGKSYCVFKEGATTFETPCIQTHKIISSDTCTSISKKYGIDRDDFYEMNPSVDRKGCGNLLNGAHYCVKLGVSRPVEVIDVKNKVAKKKTLTTTTTTTTRRRRSTKSSRTTRRVKTTTRKRTTTTKKRTTTTTTAKPTTTTTTTTTKTTTTTTTSKPKPTTDAHSSNVSDKRKLLQKGSALTYYWIAHPDDYEKSGKSINIRTCDGKSLGYVPQTYADALVMEGTGVIGDKVINLGGCTCSDYKCFMEVDKKEDPYGLTSFGTALRPFITIAANDIKRNTKIFVPEIEGWEIPGTSKKHNGCMLVDDRSWSFDSNHIDLYVYREKNYRTLNSEHKLSKVDVYEGGDCNLLNYA